MRAVQTFPFASSHDAKMRPVLEQSAPEACCLRDDGVTLCAWKLPNGPVSAAAPPEKRLFPTPWFAPVALVLSLISIILNLLALWPEAMMFIIDMFR